MKEVRQENKLEDFSAAVIKMASTEEMSAVGYYYYYP